MTDTAERLQERADDLIKRVTKLAQDVRAERLEKNKQKFPPEGTREENIALAFLKLSGELSSSRAREAGMREALAPFAAFMMWLERLQAEGRCQSIGMPWPITIDAPSGDAFVLREKDFTTACEVFRESAAHCTHWRKDVRTLIYFYTGPLMRWSDDTLQIEDLNPAVKLKWRVTRLQMIGLAWRCLKCAIFGAKP